MSVNPLEAYQSVEKATLSGRELEASVLIRAAVRLSEVKQLWGQVGYEELLDEALRYNQRLWTLFQAELTEAENPLPTEIKNNLLSLSAFVDKRSFDMLAYPELGKLDILIAINQNIAAGLRGEK
ncbi:MAG: flagellar biosynthesis regulator FlaF [Hydrogenophilaceae bacterium]